MKKIIMTLAFAAISCLSMAQTGGIPNIYLHE